MTSLTKNKKQLLSTLSNSWPLKYRIRIEGDEIVDLASHLLSEEIESVVNDRKCCLPFFISGRNEIAWFNTAQDADDLQSTVQSLRCWFIPSYGWEDDQGWIVTDDSNASGIRKQIADMSPAGYCRWRSKETEFETIAKKLAQIRYLDKAKPELPPNGPPPLIQIRQQFVTALVAGDKTSAENAIQLIETHQLDSADNSLFMWIRFWFTFNEFGRITKHKDIHRLTQLRIPKIVKQCITRAFYFAYLDDFDWTSDTDNILSAYKLDIHGVVGGLIARSSKDEGSKVARLLACWAITNSNAGLANELGSAPDLACLSDALSKVKPDSTATPELPLEDQFWIARSQKDWSRVQELGFVLVESDPESYVPLLRQSLGFNANQKLEEKLAEFNKEEILVQNDQPEVSTKTIPSSWGDWFQHLNQPENIDFAAFIADRPQVHIEQLEPQAVLEISNSLEEIYLNTEFKTNQAIRQLLLTGLPELMQDFVNESSFPRDTLVPIYSNIFRLWSELKTGSTHPPDSQVLLNLADGILTFQRDLETEVVAQFDSWWKTSPVRALLPFLLGVVDLLNSVGTEDQCSNFWIAGASYLQNNPKYLTVGERSLWRKIGIQFFDEATIDEYLPIPEEADEVDPLAAAELKKVAIISMREPQAKAAAEMIRERSGADVVLVTKKAAGAQTASAITADVVLFVWRATSHAVFRAFDSMDKEKLSYVQGTGVGSIVLALERWVANNNTR